MLTTKQAAAIANLDVSRIKILCAQGRIVDAEGNPAEKVGRDWVIPAPFKIVPAKRKIKNPGHF